MDMRFGYFQVIGAMILCAIAIFGIEAIFSEKVEIAQCAESSTHSVSTRATQVVKNEIGHVDGTIQFFSEAVPIDNPIHARYKIGGYFTNLSLSALSPTFTVYVQGDYEGLRERKYQFLVCVYDPNGNIAGSRVGYSGNFTPNESSWWKAGKFFAADVLHQTGIWRMDVILMDMTNGRRLILSRNLPVAD